MRIKHSLLALGMVAIVAAPMKAEEKTQPITVGLDVISSLDGLKGITHNNTGYGLTLGYNSFVYGTTVPMRVSASYYMMPGKVEDGLKTSLTNYQVAADVFIETGVENLRILTGLSLQRWKTDDKYDSGESHNDFVRGPKMGLRCGLEYGFTKNLAANLMVQAVELGSVPYGEGSRGINPSWLQIGVRYSF